MVVQIPVKDKVAGSSPAVGDSYRRGAMDQRKGLLSLWVNYSDFYKSELVTTL